MGRRDSFTSRPSRDYGRDYRHSYPHRRDYREYKSRRKYKEDHYRRRSRSRSRSFSPRHYHRYKSQQISDSNEHHTNSSNTASIGGTPPYPHQMARLQRDCIDKPPLPESPVKRPRIESISRASTQYHHSSSPPRLLLCKRPTLPGVQLDLQLYPHPWPADFEEELQTLYHDLRNCQNEELKMVKDQTQLKYELDCQRLEILKLESCIDALNGLGV